MRKTKNKLIRGVAFLLVFTAIFSATETVLALSANDTTDVNLDITGSLSINCPTSVAMGAITGTGQSALTTNDLSCTIITSNSTGYALSFNAATAYLENANADQIAAYTPTAAGTPEQWSVAATDSEWGARLKKTGTTTYDSTKWGDAAGAETYAQSDVKWHNVTNSGSFTVVSRTSETDALGDTEILQFGAEVGSSKFQPTGTYDVDVTLTVTTL